MPAAHPQYPSPPLVEAVFELRTSGPKPWDGTYPGRIYERVKSRFPTSRMVHRVTAPTTQPSSGGQQEIAALVQLQSVVQFESEDGGWLATIGNNSIAISRKRPYRGWAELRDAIGFALEAYVDVVQPAASTRLGLRYINHFVIDEPAVSFPAYWNVYPHLADALPQRVGQAKMQLLLDPDESPDLLNLQMYTVAPTGPSQQVIALDIDCFSAKERPIDAAMLLDWADQAHDLVFDVFENSITEKTRTLLLRRPQP